MRESIGKSAVRKIFFDEVLAGGLSHESIVRGNILLLLGEEPRELPYTDNLGVPRSGIWSMERQSEIYGAQVNQNLGIHLNYGEVASFLDNLTHSNQTFLVFNLDVEGSYLSQLDAAMTPVLLLCWRNPETLVGMYSSVGRDTEMLWEGIKSLAIFLCPRGEYMPVLESVIRGSVPRDQRGRTERPRQAGQEYLYPH
jgi:hypothetical protein